MMSFPDFPSTIPTVNRAGGDIRLSVTTSCEKGCHFCHLEGHKSQGEIGQLNPALVGWKAKRGLPMIERLGNVLQQEDVEAAMTIAALLGLTNIHLTGGEPTLHPHLHTIIHMLRKGGFTVGMTSHAELSEAKFETLLQSGLCSLNVSLHALSPAQYIAMDLQAQEIQRNHSYEAAIRYAEHHLANKQRNIRRAVAFAQHSQGTFQIKANTVIQKSETAVQIVQWCNQMGCPVRLQRDINQRATSDQLLCRTIEVLQASPVLLEIAAGDSSASGIHYTYPGGTFKIKLFGAVYVEGMCALCPFKDTERCREHFYGLRIEHGSVVTCIDRQQLGSTRFELQEFIHLLKERRGIPYEIQQNYQRMRLQREE